MLGNPTVGNESVVSHGYTATSDAKAKQYSRQGLREASGFSSVIRVFKEFTDEKRPPNSSIQPEVSFRCRKFPCYLRPTTPSMRRCKSQGFPNLAERISQCRIRFLISLPNLLSADRQSHPKLQRRRVISRVVLAEILGHVVGSHLSSSAWDRHCRARIKLPGFAVGETGGCIRQNLTDSMMLDSREGAAIIEDPGGVQTALSLYSKARLRASAVCRVCS
jgi:hypothetical protein